MSQIKIKIKMRTLKFAYLKKTKDEVYRTNIYKTNIIKHFRIFN